MKWDKRKLLLASITVLALVTGGVFAGTTGEGAVTITSGSSLAGGGLANTTPLSEAFTLFKGNS